LQTEQSVRSGSAIARLFFELSSFSRQLAWMAADVHAQTRLSGAPRSFVASSSSMQM
jgi:hypothetical protein